MRVHFIGIGGIGMSSLAQWFLAHKWSVTGSDMTESVITADLTKLGVNVKIGHSSSHIPPHTKLVVRSQAIRPQNPEFKFAVRHKIPTLTYPEALGHITRIYRTVAIAGAHGKSTTTALSALMAIRAHADPTVIIGTRLAELPQKNFRAGRSDILIIEADEYGKAFLHYTPLLAVITTIDAEHLDTYKTLAGVQKNFLKFAANILPGGTLILNRDDKNIYVLRKKFLVLAKRTGFTMVWYSLRDRDANHISRALAIPGRHNVSNALAVARLAHTLGIRPSDAVKTFRSYNGSWRRMERRGSCDGAIVYDDYAHHPTEIRATLQAFREKYPKKNIICVFEPHQAERLKRLWKDFRTAFDGTDALILLPTYQVAGRDHEHPRFNTRVLAREIERRRPELPVIHCDDPQRIRDAIDLLAARTPLSRSVIIMMGAGTIVNYTPLLLDV